MARKKVKELPDFEKDTVSQAVINTNSSAFEARRAQMAAQKSDNEMLELKNKVAELEKLIKRLSK